MSLILTLPESWCGKEFDIEVGDDLVVTPVFEDEADQKWWEKERLVHSMGRESLCIEAIVELNESIYELMFLMLTLGADSEWEIYEYYKENFVDPALYHLRRDEDYEQIALSHYHSVAGAIINFREGNLTFEELAHRWEEYENAKEEIYEQWAGSLKRYQDTDRVGRRHISDALFNFLGSGIAVAFIDRGIEIPETASGLWSTTNTPSLMIEDIVDEILMGDFLIRDFLPKTAHQKISAEQRERGVTKRRRNAARGIMRYMEKKHEG